MVVTFEEVVAAVSRGGPVALAELRHWKISIWILESVHSMYVGAVMTSSKISAGDGCPIHPIPQNEVAKCHVDACDAVALMWVTWILSGSWPSSDFPL